MKLLQTWHPSMLPSDDETIHWKKITTEEAIHLAREHDIESRIRYANLARVISSVFGFRIIAYRKYLTLYQGEQFMFVRYVGGSMLPDDAHDLPENATLDFWLGSVKQISISDLPEMTPMALNVN